MGRLNEMLGAAANYSRGLAVQFGLQEQEGVPTVAPELVPTSDIHARPEQWALHGGSLLGGYTSVAAGGVGFTSQLAFEPGEGEILIIERLIFCPQIVLSCSLHFSTTSLTTSTGNVVARDTRMIVTGGGSARSGSRILTKNDAAAANLANTHMVFFQMPVGVVVVVPLDIVLVRPWSLRVIQGATNTVLGGIGVAARARAATERELSIGAL